MRPIEGNIEFADAIIWKSNITSEQNSENT